MEFKKYQHVERFGTDEVQGIELGDCYVFPKIDGTNSQCYLNDNGELRCGSRNRELTLEKDNGEFYKNMINQKNIIDYLHKHRNHRIYGEWLIPHSLKTYKDDAWRKFYVFDVCIDNDKGELKYLSYDEYKPLLEEFDIDYIAPIKIIKNGTFEDFLKCTELNTFLIQDGKGVGEGVVIKNYSFTNRYGRTTWAKIVTNEFKEKHHKEMGSPIEDNLLVEEKITNKYVTESFVEKEFEKIKLEKDGWNSKYIPMLFSKVFYELIKEETWHILKDFKNPTINFKTLYSLCTNKVKEIKKDLF